MGPMPPYGPGFSGGYPPRPPMPNTAPPPTIESGPKPPSQNGPPKPLFPAAGKVSVSYLSNLNNITFLLN